LNLSEFISRLFNRYKSTAPDIEDKKEEITGILIAQSEKIDFQKLLDLIAKSNETDFLPAGSKILQWSKCCYKQEYKKGPSGWVHVRVYDPRYKTVISTYCFPATDTQEQILSWYKKRFNCDGWRIEEIYA
jgi:hypothetical protein